MINQSTPTTKRHLIHFILLLMAVALAASLMTMDNAAAAKKKVGKVRGAAAYVVNGVDYSPNKAHSYIEWSHASKARKYEIYKSSCTNKGFKKAKAVKSHSMKIKPDGLECYKIRGVNGKKKGKFSPMAVAYSFKTTLEKATMSPDEYGYILKVRVDNTAANARDMTFYNSSYGISYTAFGFDDFESSYDNADGWYSDADGEPVKKTTIGAGETGYIYIYLDSDSVGYYFEEAMNPYGDIELAIDQTFYIMDGSVKKTFNNYSFMRLGHGVTYNDIEYVAGDLY